jgi:hypothetical protein
MNIKGGELQRGNGAIGASHSGPTRDNAIKVARSSCENGKSPDETCYLVMVDNERTPFDPSPYYCANSSGPDPFAMLSAMSSISQAASASKAAASLGSEARSAAIQAQAATTLAAAATLHASQTNNAPPTATPQQAVAQVSVPASRPAQPKAAQNTAQVVAPAAAPSTNPLPSGCISQSTSQSTGTTFVTATNNCREPININICAVFAGDIGTRTQANPASAGQSIQFSFFNPDGVAYNYQLQYCRPGATTNFNNCPAACPSQPGN